MAATISEAIIPSPVAQMLKWTKQTVSDPTGVAAAAVARVTKAGKSDSAEKETGVIESKAELAEKGEVGLLDSVTTPGAVQTQRELHQLKETPKSEKEKTKRERGREMGTENTGTDKKTGAKTGPDVGSGGKGGNGTPKRAKVQLKTEVKVELEVEGEDATQVGVCIQFQSRWEGFTLRQLMKDMVRRSTRYIRRATWCYVGRVLRYAASYV